MNVYDLIVVGAGIIGAACADAAAAEGLRTAVVEPGPVGGGATAASMGHLVALDGNPVELELAHYSLGYWERLAQIPETEFDRCGTLWVARHADELDGLRERAGRLAEAGVCAQVVEADTLYTLEPSLAPGLAGGMRVRSDATVYPPRAARMLVQRAQSHGARLFAGRSARLWTGGVRLDDGTRLHGPVLVATGAAVSQLLPILPMRKRKGHLLITERYPGVLHHQVLESGYAASAHGETKSSVAFNAQPRPGGQILLGSSREFDVDSSAVSTAMLQRMVAHAFDFLPILRTLRALRVWTGFRPTTPDGLPYMGAVPGRADTWVAAGHEGLGVTTAPGSARLMLDLIRGRTPAIDPRPFSPARVAA